MSKKESYTIRVGVEGGKVVSAELGKIGADGEKSFQRISSAGKGASRTMGDLSTMLMTRLVPALAAGFSTSKIKEYSDTFKGLEGRLKVAVGEGLNLAAVQEQLFSVAQNNSSPLEAVIDAYSRLSLALPEAIKHQTDMIDVTDLLSKTLLISGASADGAKTFFQQFGQAASNDFKAIGQELQTFADQNSFFYKILQEEAAKYGKSLKDLAKDGGLSFQFIVDALNSSRTDIEAGLGSIPVTIEKAFTQLDNAFLKLIGQSDLVNQGTSSIAAGIVLLAQNLDVLAEAVTYVSVAMGGRFVTSLYLANAAKAAAVVQATAYQMALMRMAGVSSLSVAATMGLAGAMRVLSGAMALVGGPIGVALIGTMALMHDSGNAAADAQALLNEQMGAFQNAASQYGVASDELRRKIEEDAAARIEAYKQELIALDAIVGRLDSENWVFRKSREIGAGIGIDTSADDVRKVADDVKAAIAQIEQAQAQFDGIRTGTGIYAPRVEAEEGKKGKGGLSEEEKRAKAIHDVTAALKFQNEQILRSEKEQALYNELRKAGVSLDTEAGQQIRALVEEQFALNAVLEAQGAITESATKALADYADAAKDTEKQLVDAALGGLQAFEDSMVGLIKGTESVSDAFSSMVDSILEDLIRMQVKQNITGPLSESLNGIIGSIFQPTLSSGAMELASGGSLFNMPMFSRGGIADRPSIFGEAGPEAAVPLPDGRSIPVTLSGGTGGGAQVINQINIIDQNNTDVQTSTRTDGNGNNVLDIVLKAVARDIGTPGTAIHSRIKNFNVSQDMRRG